MCVSACCPSQSTIAPAEAYKGSSVCVQSRGSATSIRTNLRGPAWTPRHGHLKMETAVPMVYQVISSHTCGEPFMWWKPGACYHTGSINVGPHSLAPTERLLAKSIYQSSLVWPADDSQVPFYRLPFAFYPALLQVRAQLAAKTITLDNQCYSTTALQSTSFPCHWT